MNMFKYHAKFFSEYRRYSAPICWILFKCLVENKINDDHKICLNKLCIDLECFF